MRQFYDDFQLVLAQNQQKIISTVTACAASAFATYPVELSRVRWEAKTLAKWDPEETLLPHSNGRRKLRIVTPLVRLLTNELAVTALSNLFLSQSGRDTYMDQWKRDVLAGSAAGCCQALLLAPIEMYQVHKHMNLEMEVYSSWTHWIKSHILEGGTLDPEERRRRAFGGVGVIAAREVVFNVTFFPLFHYFQKEYFHWSADTLPISALPKSITTIPGITQTVNVLASGVTAGMVCSLAVTPMDILKTLKMHSRERWNLWSGLQLQAPPLSIVVRGLTLQAFCFGPVFGIVAAIYELNS